MFQHQGFLYGGGGICTGVCVRLGKVGVYGIDLEKDTVEEFTIRIMVCVPSSSSSSSPRPRPRPPPHQPRTGIQYHALSGSFRDATSLLRHAMP